ncbi:MAG: WD40 repeat domain-containing protein [Sneathiella sp.]
MAKYQSLNEKPLCRLLGVILKLAFVALIGTITPIQNAQASKDTGQRLFLKSTPTYHQPVNLMIDPSGQPRLLVHYRSGLIDIFDISNLQDIVKTAEIDSNISSFDMSKDGELIVTGSTDGVIQYWNFYGEPISDPVHAYDAAVLAIAVSDDGQKLATTAEAGPLAIWRLKTQDLLNKFRVGSGSRTIEFSPDSTKIAVGGRTKILSVMSSERALSKNSYVKITGFGGKLSSIKFSPDGKLLLIAAKQGGVQLWNIEDNTQKKPITTIKVGSPSSAYFSNDGKHIYASDNKKRLTKWSLDGVNLWSPKLRPKFSYKVLSLSPDEKFSIALNYQSQIDVWDDNGNQIGVDILTNTSKLKALSISNDKKYIAVGSTSGVIWVWSVLENRVIQLSTNDNYSVNKLAFSPKGDLIVAMDKSSKVFTWDMSGNIVLPPIDYGRAVPKSIAFSPDGRQFSISAGGYTVGTWKTSGQELQPPKKIRYNSPIKIKYTRNGENIISISNAGVLGIHSLDGKPSIFFQEKTHKAKDFKIDTDTNTVLSTDGDGTVYLWDLDTMSITKNFRVVPNKRIKGKELPFKGPKRRLVQSLADSTDRAYRFLGGDDGILRMMNKKGDVVSQVNNCMGRDLVGIGKNSVIALCGNHLVAHNFQSSKSIKIYFDTKGVILVGESAAHFSGSNINSHVAAYDKNEQVHVSSDTEVLQKLINWLGLK